jgi:hypothetical protein
MLSFFISRTSFASSKKSRRLRDETGIFKRFKAPCVANGGPPPLLAPPPTLLRNLTRKTSALVPEARGVTIRTSDTRRQAGVEAFGRRRGKAAHGCPVGAPTISFWWTTFFALISE